MRAWHFLNNEGLLRTGDAPPPDGKWLGNLVIRHRGLHASVNILDALLYAPGNIVCRVEMGGTIIQGYDKLVASRMKILWRYDASDVLRHFACLCALDMIYLWSAPPVVVQYLKTRDESLRKAAREVVKAREAVGGAWEAERKAKKAAWAATGDTAWVAARDTLLEATWVGWNKKAFAKQSKRLYRMIMEGRKK